MTKLFESDADVCLIPAAIAKNSNLSEVLLPVLCSQANTGGGTVIIGAARASDDSIVFEGLSSISKTQFLIDELISDKSKISANTIKNIKKTKEQGKDILIMEVAPALWTERPVYINSDPVKGVYSFTGGQRVISDKKLVTLMAKDSVDPQIDNERLEYFSEIFIDYKAIEKYREFHREKRPFPKWDLLNDENYLERIGAKSDGCLLRAGTLMFGTNENVSFCLYRVNNGIEVKHEARNIWSFIELVLPVFDSCGDLECKSALFEAFFNSLIHADYSNGKIKVIIEDNEITFSNSGIPRSCDNSSVCRNLRIMKMLCLVGYAKNKGSGMELINHYSQNIKLSANYENWETKIVIPVSINEFAKTEVIDLEVIELEKIVKEKTEQEKSIIPSVFYPVAKLAKLASEQETKIAEQVSSEEKSSYGEDDVVTLESIIHVEEAVEEVDIEDTITVSEEIEAPEKLAFSEPVEEADIAGDISVVEETVETEEIIFSEPVEEADIAGDISVAEGPEVTEEIVLSEPVEEADIAGDISVVEETVETEEIVLFEPVEEVDIAGDISVAEEPVETEEIVLSEPVEEADIAGDISVTEETEETEEIVLSEPVEEADTVGDISIADETEETEEIVLSEPVEEVDIEGDISVIEEPEVTEEIVIFEPVGEADIAGEISVVEETEETEEIVISEPVEEADIAGDISIAEEPEETEEIVISEPVEEVDIEGGIYVAEEVRDTEEIIIEADKDNEEVIAEKALIDFAESKETEESEYFLPDDLDSYYLDKITKEQQEDSWDILKDSEQRRILEQLIKEYISEPSFWDKEKNDVRPDKDVTIVDGPKDIQTFEIIGKTKFRIGTNSETEPQHSGVENTIEDENGKNQFQLTEESLDNKKKQGGKKSAKSAEKTLKNSKGLKGGKITTVEENPIDYDENNSVNYTQTRLRMTDDFSAAVSLVRENVHASSAMIKDALFEYCSNGFKTIGEMSSALLRPESSIKRIISRMVKEGTLEVNKNNAYRTVQGITGDA